MSSSSFRDVDINSNNRWDPFQDDFSVQETQLQDETLGFCQLTDWDEGKSYDKDPPQYIHYSIEWRVRINNREVSKDTEQNLVLQPSSYWRLFLQPNLERVLLSKMMAKKRTIKSEDTKIVVAVTQRSERDVTKSFDSTNIDWPVIEKQILQ